jgi:hypothetical protein
MDVASERSFGLDQGTTRAHIRSDLEAMRDDEPGQKNLGGGVQSFLAGC